METNVMTGTWTAYTTKISDEAATVFKKAMEGIIGKNYTALAVATQSAAGTNYRFFCNAKAVYPDAPNEGAIVQIYYPVNGIPTISSIKVCD